MASQPPSSASSFPPQLPPRKPSLSASATAPSLAPSPFSSSIIVALLPPPLRRRVTAAAAVTSSSRSRFSLLFALLFFLVLILSFHVRDVVQKANKENRLLEYGSQVSEASDLLRGVSRDANNLAQLFRAAQGGSPTRQKKGPPQSGDTWL